MTLNPREHRHQPRHAPRAPFAVLLCGMLGGGLVLLLGLNTAAAANELRRHDLAARDEGIAASLVALRNAVAASAAPENLARHAAEYGMVPAGNPAFLVVGASGSVRILGSAAPASAPPLPAPPSSSTPKPKPKPTKPKATKSAAAKRPGAQRQGGHSQATSVASRGAGHASPSPTPHRSSSPTPKPSPTPARPSSTPVPTITLPGGTR